MTIQNTLLLDQSAWDLVLDINGNIALAGTPYSYAQDVASAVRTFLGECWYDTSLGLPYWQQILGKLPPAVYIEQTLIMNGYAKMSTAIYYSLYERKNLYSVLYLR